MFGFGNVGEGSQTDDGDLKPKTWDDYNRSVLAGLPASERGRMADAYDQLRYANGHFDDVEAEKNGADRVTTTTERWDPIRPASDDTRYEKTDFTLGMPVMQRVVGELCKHLYKRAPTREMGDKAVGIVVNETYKRNGMGGKFKRADEFTAIGGASAFQFAGDDDGRSPLKIHLWSADELCVWLDGQDPTRVDAVATVEKVDGRTRVRLWTEETVSYYTTKRDQYDGPTQARKFTLLSKKPNPYRLPETSETDDQGRGIIPFSFNHFVEPTTEFTWDSPGRNLRELNRYVNYGFDDLADGVRYLTKPIGKAEGVAEDWEAPAVMRPGMFLNLAAGQVDAGGNGPQPNLSYLEADNSFVQVIWQHLNNYLDTSLEMHGVPPSTVRMMLGDKSGIAVLAEQSPLLGWTQCRRQSWAHYELQAVERFLQVLAAHMRNHSRDAKRFDASAIDPGLALMWPRLYVDLPGPERDRADTFRMQTFQCSLIDLVTERDDCTRAQAWSKVERVKADNERLTGMGLDPLAAVGGSIKQAEALPGTGPAEPGAVPSATKQLDQLSNSGPDSGITGEPVDSGTKADGISQEGG